MARKQRLKMLLSIGKHSELLKITDNPFNYQKKQVKLFNDEYRKENKVSLELKVNFADKSRANNSFCSESTLFNMKQNI